MLVNGIDTPDDKHSKHSKYTNLIDENNQLIEYMCLSKKPFAFDIDRVGKDGHTTIFTGTVFRGSIWPPKRVKVPMLDGSTEEVLIEWITSGDVAKEGDKCSLMTMTEINIDEIKIGGCLTEKEE